MKFSIIFALLFSVACSHSIEKNSALDQRLESVPAEAKIILPEDKVQERINLFLIEYKLKQEEENKLTQVYIEDLLKHDDSSHDLLLVKKRLSRLEKSKIDDLKLLKYDVDALINRPLKKKIFNNERRMNREH